MKIVATEKAPKALGPYSQGYVHNGVLYTAGQIAINPEVCRSNYNRSTDRAGMQELRRSLKRSRNII